MPSFIKSDYGDSKKWLDISGNCMEAKLVIIQKDSLMNIACIHCTW